MNYETTVKGSDSRPYQGEGDAPLDDTIVDDTADKGKSRRTLILIVLLILVAIAGFFAWRSFGADSAPVADRDSQLPTVTVIAPDCATADAYATAAMFGVLIVVLALRPGGLAARAGGR